MPSQDWAWPRSEALLGDFRAFLQLCCDLDIRLKLFWRKKGQTLFHCICYNVVRHLAGRRNCWLAKALVQKERCGLHVTVHGRLVDALNERQFLFGREGVGKRLPPLGCVLGVGLST